MDRVVSAPRWLVVIGFVGLMYVVFSYTVHICCYPPNYESRAIGDVRTVMSAEAAYAEANGGYYDKIECLQRPSDCLPDYPANAATFLDPMMVNASRYGYVRSFHYGPAVTHGQSPSSLKGFAYVAVPMAVGQTGNRAYCGDSRGIICFTADGSAPRVVGGLCPLYGDPSKESSCRLLQ
jgi:hypothetical protein